MDKIIFVNFYVFTEYNNKQEPIMKKKFSNTKTRDIINHKHFKPIFEIQNSLQHFQRWCLEEEHNSAFQWKL